MKIRNQKSSVKKVMKGVVSKDFAICSFGSSLQSISLKPKSFPQHPCWIGMVCKSHGKWHGFGLKYPDFYLEKKSYLGDKN